MIVRILLIVVLNIVWVSIMVGTLIIPTMPEFIDNSMVNSVLGGLLCDPNEQLRRIQSDDNEGISIFCRNMTAETNRDVSDRLLVIGLFGTGVAFLLSTLAEIAFALSLYRNKMKPKVQPEIGFIGQPKPQINISETLRQLQEAQKAGLISYDEYDQKRQDIFKNL